MQIDQSKKCTHKPCRCLAEEGGDYCSTYCEDAAAGGRHEARDGCGCGHPGCVPVAGVPTSAVGGG
jgi:hypothetical protein